jgi:hypothetical protein
MTHPVIGTFTEKAGSLKVNIPELMTSRLLIQADSGGGKSYLIRKLCEQLYGKVQIIVLDTEGEFASLREKGDYLLVGEAGDMPTPPAPFAGLLARRLVEERANAVIDLYDLTRTSKMPLSRSAFVAAFLNGLLALPKTLWRPVLVIIDEAQDYAPEGGKEIPSQQAMADFSAQARKRGMCPCYATNRLGRISKDAVAGFRNYMIGMTALDVDNKRACQTLGFDNLGAATLKRGMNPGDFFVFGPAFCREVTRVHVGRVATTHPQPGKPMPPVPPPKDRVLKMLAEFKELPAQAEKEIRTLKDAQGKVEKLEGELKALKRELEMAKVTRTVEVEVEEKNVVSPKMIKALEKSVKGLAKTMEAEERALRDANVLLEKKAKALQAVAFDVTVLTKTLELVTGGTGKFKMGAKPDRAAEWSEGLRKTYPPRAVPVPVPGAILVAHDLEARHRKVLAAIHNYHPEHITTTQCATLSGYSAKSDSFLNILRKLRTDGLICYERGQVWVEDSLKDSLLPTGACAKFSDVEHVAFWGDHLEARHRKVLAVIFDRQGEDLTTANIAALSDYSPKSDSFLNILRFLAKNDLIVYGQGRAYTSNFLRRRT